MTNAFPDDELLNSSFVINRTLPTSSKIQRLPTFKFNKEATSTISHVDSRIGSITSSTAKLLLILQQLSQSHFSPSVDTQRLFIICLVPLFSISSLRTIERNSRVPIFDPLHLPPAAKIAEREN